MHSHKHGDMYARPPMCLSGYLPTYVFVYTYTVHVELAHMLVLKNNMFLCTLVLVHKLSYTSQAHAAAAAKADCDGFR